jgi:hypothetical protein
MMRGFGAPSHVLTWLLMSVGYTAPSQQPTPSHAGVPSLPADSSPAFLLPPHIASQLAAAFNTMARATRVEDYRIDPASNNVGFKIGDFNDRSVGIVGYSIIQRGPDLSTEQTRRLSSFLKDPRGYCGRVFCGPISPGVAFRFVADGHIFTILVCFRCHEWEFWLDREYLGRDTFSALQPELLTLARELFPNDPVVAGIKRTESVGRWYQIAELQNPALTVEQRLELMSTWSARIIETVGEHELWREVGGHEYDYMGIVDPPVLVVITRPRGHEAILKLPGITDITPKP